MTPHHVHQLVDQLLGPAEAEVSCEQCFELLDQYVDLQIAGGAADDALPGMRAHLHGCPACAEDAQSLREFLEHAAS